MKASKALGKAILVILISLFCFLLCEGAARIWLSSFAKDHQISKYGTVKQVEELRHRFARHHYLPFIPKPNYQDGENKHNSLGYRGQEVAIPKPETVFRIVLLGGSTTYTEKINDYRKTYPFLLQERLRDVFQSVEVVNAGCPLYSTWESLLNLQLRILDLEPDLVIVNHGINDVHTRLVYPYTAYRADNSGSRVPYERPMEGGLYRSALIRIIMTCLGVRIPLTGLLFTRTYHYVPTNFASQFDYQKKNGFYPSDIFQEHRAEEMLEKNPPDYFKRNLENMIAICSIHGIKIALMTFAWDPGFGNYPRVRSKQYNSAYKEQNAVIQEICKAQNVPCFDFAKVMPKGTQYWADGRHVTEAGAVVKARIVAKFLFQFGLIR